MGIHNKSRGGKMLMDGMSINEDKLLGISSMEDDLDLMNEIAFDDPNQVVLHKADQSHSITSSPLIFRLPGSF